MRKTIVIVNYPDSSYGADVVAFEVPDQVHDYQIMDEIQCARQHLCLEDFSTPQGLMDMALTKAANALKAKWEYVPTAGTVDFNEWDDPDPVEYEEEEE